MYLPYSLSSSISTIVWYSSGKIDITWVIISELSMGTTSFCRYPLSSWGPVTHYSEVLVTLSSLLLANLLPSIVLENPVVGSNFLESFVPSSFAFTYLLEIVFASSAIWNQKVSYCAIIRLLHAVKMSNLSEKISFNFVLSDSLAGIF